MFLPSCSVFCVLGTQNTAHREFWTGHNSTEKNPLKKSKCIILFVLVSRVLFSFWLFVQLLFKKLRFWINFWKYSNFISPPIIPHYIGSAISVPIESVVTANAWVSFKKIPSVFGLLKKLRTNFCDDILLFILIGCTSFTSLKQPWSRRIRHKTSANLSRFFFFTAIFFLLGLLDYYKLRYNRG